MRLGILVLRAALVAVLAVCLWTAAEAKAASMDREAPIVDDPCALAITFLCRFMPVAPDLDGDLDLTLQQPPVGAGMPAPESLPPIDPCSMGCI
jgi:hypothetical protein